MTRHYTVREYLWNSRAKFSIRHINFYLHSIPLANIIHWLEAVTWDFKRYKFPHTYTHIYMCVRLSLFTITWSVFTNKLAAVCFRNLLCPLSRNPAPINHFSSHRKHTVDILCSRWPLGSHIRGRICTQRHRNFASYYIKNYWIKTNFTLVLNLIIKISKRIYIYVYIRWFLSTNRYATLPAASLGPYQLHWKLFKKFSKPAKIFFLLMMISSRN